MKKTITTRRIKDAITRVISFINRTETQLLRAMQMLRMRYKSVRIDRKLVKGLYTGSITVAY